MSHKRASPPDGPLQDPNPKRASLAAGLSPPYTNGVNGRRDSELSVHMPSYPPGSLGATGTSPQQQQQQDPPRTNSSDQPKQDQQSTVTLGITRKVKACAACRKQKIKCIMNDDRPPCRRCSERNLSCVLNKSLQTHMDEESRWRNTVSHDLLHMHKALDDVLHSLSKPPLPAFETVVIGEPNHNRNYDDVSSPTETGNDLCDMSPKLSTADESLAQIPIESLYELTRLRSLRSAVVGSDPNVEQSAKPLLIDDFITKGVIQLQDAERLVSFYITKLDPYIYGLGSKYGDLQHLRRVSPVLTACICAVSALHEPDNNKLYEVCNREFRHLIANTMFNRHLSVEYLRALCIGSYWLSDVSWTLSGMAVRGAGHFNLHKYYYKAINRSDISTPATSPSDQQDGLVSMDRTRLWYLLYICDQHLSILYNRAPMIREEETILGWKAYLESSNSTDSDTRISSQVALLVIMSQIRDLFGTDTSQPIPKAFASHILSFSQQLDRWLAQWSTALKPNDFIGDFPSKGVLLHYQFGKLHLCAHVFRGLKTEDEIEAIPICFKHAASTAVTSAVSILELILQDDDLRNSLVGVPHYFHTMIAFAGVVLLKVSGKYHVQLSIDLESVFTLTSSVISLFRSTACSRYHLVRWMATGLEKMLYNCRMFTSGRYGTINPGLSGGPRSGLSVAENPVENWAIDAQPTEMYHGTPGSGFHNLILGNNFGSDLNMIVSDFPPGDIDLGFNFL